jgi:hypothetical protein
MDKERGERREEKELLSAVFDAHPLLLVEHLILHLDECIVNALPC